jgi:superfamily II DNA helicase RecQ
MGPRFPARIHPPVDPARALPARAAHRADGHRRPGPAPRSRSACSWKTRASSSPRSTAPTSVTDRRKDQRPQAAARLHHDRAWGDAGIVYCLSRKKVEETAEFLNENGIRALPYHAGMEYPVRADNQARFLREDSIVMVATIAFGMGIDKPDVRFVCHLDLPKSHRRLLPGNRTRRPRRPAGSNAWMAYGLQDVVLQRRMIDESEADETFKRVLSNKLDAMLGLCETLSCRRMRMLEYFGERSGPCGNCDTCLIPPVSFDATVPVQKLLSAIYRVDQRFAAGHVIDVLRGVTIPSASSSGTTINCPCSASAPTAANRNGARSCAR